MAVIIQKLVGRPSSRYFYPAISGVAQSYNYYPFGPMKPDEGIATIALGLGKTVMEGEKALRFSPRHPQQLPQRSTLKDILDNSQRFFYSLKLQSPSSVQGAKEDANLEKREVAHASTEEAVRALSGYFLPNEGRIRESYDPAGYPVLTFSQVLKYDLGRGRKWGSDWNRALDAVLGGWSVQAIYQAQTGRPVSTWGNLYHEGDWSSLKADYSKVKDGLPIFDTSGFYFSDAAVQTNGVVDPAKQRADTRMQLAQNIRYYPTRLPNVRQQS